MYNLEFHTKYPDPVSLTFFYHNSNSIEISFHSYLDCNAVIATNNLHGTTAVLSWYVQTFLAIYWLATELQQGKVPIEFELRAKLIGEINDVYLYRGGYQGDLWLKILQFYQKKSFKSNLFILKWQHLLKYLELVSFILDDTSCPSY